VAQASFLVVYGGVFGFMVYFPQYICVMYLINRVRSLGHSSGFVCSIVAGMFHGLNARFHLVTVVDFSPIHHLHALTRQRSHSRCLQWREGVREPTTHLADRGCTGAERTAVVLQECTMGFLGGLLHASTHRCAHHGE